MLQQTQLTHADARRAWLNHKGLTNVMIDPRFDTSHLLEHGIQASRSASIKATMKRFEDENGFNDNNFELTNGLRWVHAATFSDVDQNTLVNRIVGNANLDDRKRASLHQGRQQLCRKVRVFKRTVAIVALAAGTNEHKQFKDKTYAHLYENPRLGVRKYKLPDGQPDVLIFFLSPTTVRGMKSSSCQVTGFLNLANALFFLTCKLVFQIKMRCWINIWLGSNRKTAIFPI